MPQGGAEQRSTRALITVDILDVNDNAPSFPQDAYTAVIPENAPPGVSVVNITAVDPDEGKGGTIHFEIIDEGEANGESSPSVELFRLIILSDLSGIIETISHCAVHRPV